MTHIKDAQTDHPIQDALAQRWSPYCFADRDVATEDLLAILEAARWAPSSYNEQPWRFILARRSQPEAFAKLLSCLVEANQVWAKQAPVLLIGVTLLNFARNGNPNKAAQHDLGLAAGNLSLEATARGLAVHQMSGIVPDKVHALYRLPDDALALTAIAIGYVGSGDGMPEELQARDQTPRSRRPLRETVFENVWGEGLT